MPPNPTPEDIRIEFGRRLQAAMLDAGWNQSELARRAAQYMPDGKFGRDLVSDYINGRTLPTPVSLNALCKALGREIEELRPIGVYPAMEENASGPRFVVKRADDGRMWVDIRGYCDWAEGIAFLPTLPKGLGGSK